MKERKSTSLPGSFSHVVILAAQVEREKGENLAGGPQTGQNEAVGPTCGGGGVVTMVTVAVPHEAFHARRDSLTTTIGRGKLFRRVLNGWRGSGVARGLMQCTGG